jgi:hypothetical protein
MAPANGTIVGVDLDPAGSLMTRYAAVETALLPDIVT